MKKFKIVITEYMQRVIEQEGESQEEALEKVKKEYYDGNILLNYDDLKGESIEIYDPNKSTSKF